VRLAGIVMMVLAATPAMAVDVLLHWQAGAGDLPAGYRLHVRTGSGHYVAAHDVGPARRRADGTFEASVTDLDPQTSYAFAVSAYGDDGDTLRSNEIAIPAQVGPCASLAEGAACDPSEPCRAGTCADGACVSGPPPASGASSARVVARGRTVRGRGRFHGLGPVDPVGQGFTMRLEDPDGVALDDIDVPPGTFIARRRRTVFRYRARRPLRRVLLRLVQDGVEVRFRVHVAATPAGTGPLEWHLRVGGDACATTPQMPCSPSRVGWRCGTAGGNFDAFLAGHPARVHGKVRIVPSTRPRA
jgi:hypothetical protein